MIDVESFADFDSVLLFGNDSNERLSVVYNTVVKSIDSDYIVILDDDSKLTQGYMVSVCNAIEARVTLAIPQILHGESLISPGLVRGVRGKQLTRNSIKAGPDYRAGLVAMMSGSVIKVTSFKRLEFDERLQLYGVDTKYFLDYHKHYSSIYILDCIIEHDSALRDPSVSIDKMISSYRILISSWCVVYEHCMLHRLRLAVRLLLFVAKQILVRKSWKPLKLLPCIITFFPSLLFLKRQ
jgi:hypothetical protein